MGLSPALIVLMSVADGPRSPATTTPSRCFWIPSRITLFAFLASSAGFIVTAAQLGHAAGLLFLVPLGDMFERRTPIVSMTLLAVGGMLITAAVSR